MRKFTFVFIMMLGFSSLAMAQVIENFEPIKMFLFNNGDNASAVTVVANPDRRGADSTAYCGKMIRGGKGKGDAAGWAGWYNPLTDSLNTTVTRYVHLKVWKTTKSRVNFKLEKGPMFNGSNRVTGDVFPMNTPDSSNTVVNAWQELVFDLGQAAITYKGNYGQITFIPDHVKNLTDTTNLTIYFDDIYANNDPAVGSAPVRILENFTTIDLNVMAEAPPDNSAMTAFFPNPVVSGVNVSDYVVKFLRGKDGSLWSGFWSTLPTPLDVTNNHYVHVKVLKPRISPLRFKLERPGLNKEFVNPGNTKIGQWEDIVFDVSEFTGAYTVIAFMPDRVDPGPVGLTEDITIYFDDIVLNNDPNPIVPPIQTISVNMGGNPLGATDHLWITGNFGNATNGTWVGPGEKPANEMTDPDGDGIYSVNLSLTNGSYEFKFVKNAWGGANEDPLPGAGNKSYTINGNVSLTYIWGESGVEVGVKEKPLAGKVNIYPNPVRNELNVNSTADLRSATITSMVGKVVGKYTFNNAGTHSINTSGLKSGIYFVTFVGKDGLKVTQKLVKD